MSHYIKATADDMDKLVILKTLPEHLPDPMYFLDVDQQKICQQNKLLSHLIPFLPCYISANYIANALNYGPSAINNALIYTQIHYGSKMYVWATQFENCHTFWTFQEPDVTHNGITYRDSEQCYQLLKPHYPWSKDEEITVTERRKAMTIAVRGKFLKNEGEDKYAETRKKLCILLMSTYPHPLLSIKSDDIWGISYKNVRACMNSKNMLAEILMELRKELCDESTK